MDSCSWMPSSCYIKILCMERIGVVDRLSFWKEEALPKRRGATVNPSHRRQMKMRTGGEVVHSYNRQCVGNIVFCSDIDRLVFFTMFCTYAKKLDIKILGLSIMLNHVHNLTRPAAKKQLSMFMDMVLSTFSRQFNKDRGRHGSVWHPRFGRAVKHDDKDVRQSIIYLADNQMEKKHCKRVRETRWNFMAYAKRRHPFSKKLSMTKMSPCLHDAVRAVDFEYDLGNYLNYSTLRRIFKGLVPAETQQLIDYIIVKYNVIDYQEAGKYFGGVEMMLKAMNRTIAHEYDIKELMDGPDDRPYFKMISSFGEAETAKFLVLSVEKKIEIAEMILKKALAPKYHICRLLWLDEAFS